MDNCGELLPGTSGKNVLGQNETSIPEDDPFIKSLRALDAKMDRAYEDQLRLEIRSEATIISFDNIQDGDGSVDQRIRRITELIAKYGEYTKRLKDDKRDLTTNPYATRSAYYKREVARLVIVKGSVNTWVLGKAIEHVHQIIDLYRFQNGCAVIEGYIKNGGKGVVGGTGLPNFTGRPK